MRIYVGDEERNEKGGSTHTREAPSVNKEIQIETKNTLFGILLTPFFRLYQKK